MGVPDLSKAIPIAAWSLVGGLDVSQSPTQIDPSCCQAVNNMVGFEGKLRRRAGWNAVFATLPAGYAVNHVTALFTLSGAAPVPVVIARKLSDNTGRLYSWNGAAWVDQTSSFSFSCSALVRTTSCCLEGVLYVATGGVSDLFQWTGSGAPTTVVNIDTDITPYTKPQILMSWDNRLWMGNMLDPNTSAVLASTVAWSDRDNPTVWQVAANGSSLSAGFEQIEDASYTAPITGLIDTRNYLFAFQQDAVYFAQPASNVFYQFLRLSRGIGCVAQATLKRYEEMIFWLGNEDVFACTDQQTAQKVTQKVRTRMRQVWNLATIGQAIASLDVYNQLYWVFAPSAADASVWHIFVFSIRDNGWWEGQLATGTAIAPECSFEFRQGFWQINSLLGSTDGNVYQMEGYPAVASDGGTPFACSWRSKRWDTVALGSTYQVRLQGADGAFETLTVQKWAGHASAGVINVTPYYGPGATTKARQKAVTLNFATGDNFVTLDQTADRFVEMQLDYPDITNAPELEGMTQHIMPRGMVPRR